MKLLAAIALVICFVPSLSRAADTDLATLTCSKYQNEVLPRAASSPTADPINTVMWMFGFSVAKSGAHYMYGDALEAFGFALDAQCKNNPNESVLDALALVKPDAKNPMDLTSLQCATFAKRHMDLARSDAESANTIMMWLLGFAVAKSGSHIFNADALSAFEPGLLAQCAKHSDQSLFDALVAVKATTPVK